MARFFNTSGPCDPARHYMLPALRRLPTVRTCVVMGVTTKAPPANKPFGEWNALRVVARRHVIEVEVNGARMPTANLDEKLALAKTQPELLKAKGPVGLVCYIGTVEYRNVRVRPLSQ